MDMHMDMDMDMHIDIHMEMNMDIHKPVRKYSELKKGQREWKTEYSHGRKDKRVKVLHIFGRISREVITVK